MASRGWRPVWLVHGLYLGCFLAGLVLSAPTSVLGLSMGLFAILVVVVDWSETRLLAQRAHTRRDWASLVGLTSALLAVWLGVASRPPGELDLYFALLAGFFVLQAVRAAAVRDLSPIGVILEGYPSLVAIYLVLGAAADAIAIGQVALVILAAGVYVVRKLFRWVSTILDWLTGPQHPTRE